MIIQEAATGFHVWRDNLYNGPAVGVKSDKVEACMAYYRQGNFVGLFGCPSFGFHQDNLDFLTQATDAQWLWFWDVKLKNIDALYQLDRVDYLGINPKRPGIDFSKLPSLKSVTNHWIKKDCGIAQSKIQEYNLWHYKPTSKSFEDLEIPSGVKRLELTWANPASLEGLPVMKKLKVLQIHRSRNLADLSALPRIAPNLEELLTTTSSKIDATVGVLDHPKLKMALIDGNFVLGGEDKKTQSPL